MEIERNSKTNRNQSNRKGERVIQVKFNNETKMNPILI